MVPSAAASRLFRRTVLSCTTSSHPEYAATITPAACNRARLWLQLSRPVSPSHCSLPAQPARLLQLPAGSLGRKLPGAWECPACGRCRRWGCPAGCGLYTSPEQAWSGGPALWQTEQHRLTCCWSTERIQCTYTHKNTCKHRPSSNADLHTQRHKTMTSTGTPGMGGSQRACCVRSLDKPP